jgi:hypothetical protein
MAAAAATFPNTSFAGAAASAGDDDDSRKGTAKHAPTKGVLDDAKAFGVVYGVANAAAVPTGQSYSQLTGQAVSGLLNVVKKAFSWFKWKKLAAIAGKLASIASLPVIAGTIAVCAAIAVTYIITK